MFYKCCGDWMTHLDDKYDHHPRVICYVLTGLFDTNEDI